MGESNSSNHPPASSALRRAFTAVPLWSWLLLFGVIGGIVGLGGYTFAYAEGASYFSNDPSACVNCHVMQEVYDGWNHGSHKAVAACNDCHTPHTFPAKYVIKGINGWNHSVAFTTGNFPNPIRITDLNRQVAYDNCLYCHGSLVTAVSHEDSADPTDCLTCHAGVGHGR
ncbi:MAG: cytochrome c nitrite reductase small subunit [Chloroflexi bacterium]|nr:cytochrome c nitrite reductase small subunit [Chloroflexota bacterium]